MRIPNAENAVVEREKIVEYLLNPAHPDNGGKARFFLALGFSSEDWQTLADALRQVALAFHVAKSVASPHGSKYILDGRIRTPCGKSPMVRTIWIVDAGTQTPRLVTAYPREERERT